MNNEHDADRAELERLNLHNPDDVENEYFDWPDEFLQRILGSLLCDPYFLIQGMDLIKPEYFRENVHRFLCKTTLDHYKKYNKQPDEHILEAEIREHIGTGLSLEYYLAEMRMVCDAYEPGLERREYFLDKITEFAKTQSLRLAYHKTLSLFGTKDAGKWAKIRALLEEAFLVERNVEIGLDYFETIEERYKRVMQGKEEKEYFPTGFPLIDQALGGGMLRGEAGAFAGMSGSGKSLALVKVSKENLLRGKNVLYVSLELDEDLVAERFDSMITNYPIRSLYFDPIPRNVKVALDEERGHCGCLVIKQFPAGAADVSTVRAYIAQLNLHDFVPDLVIIDYVGECRDIPGIKTYESRQRLIRDMRGLATELDICLLTAMQVNRGGRDAMENKGYLDDDVLADSIGQVRPLDALWTISQNDTEQKAAVGTIFISKHRRGVGRLRFYFERDINTLEMREISKEKYEKELSKVKDKSIDEIEMEKLSGDTKGFF